MFLFLIVYAAFLSNENDNINGIIKLITDVTSLRGLQVCLHRLPFKMYYNTISIEHFCFRSLAFKYLCIAFRVRQNLDKDFILIDPDPGKAYTRAKKARCRFCSVEEQLRNPESQEPEALVTDTDVDVEES